MKLKLKLKKLRSSFDVAQAKVVTAAHTLSRVPTKIYILGVYVGIAASSGHANAAGLMTGWRDMINETISLLTVVATLAGIGAVLYGLTQLVKKGMGRGDDIEWREIMWPLVGGASLTVLMYVVDGLVVESGAQTSDMGGARSFGTTTTP